MIIFDLDWARRHRHLIAVCDLSLIKWDLFQIIFNHRDVLAFERIVNRLRTNRLIESREWHSTCLSLEYQTYLQETRQASSLWDSEGGSMAENGRSGVSMYLEEQSETDQHPWFALRVKSRTEKVVSTIARNKGYEEFLPLYQCRRKWSDRFKSVELPLFPGYVFCRLNPEFRLPHSYDSRRDEFCWYRKGPESRSRKLKLPLSERPSALACQPNLILFSKSGSACGLRKVPWLVLKDCWLRFARSSAWSFP